MKIAENGVERSVQRVSGRFLRGQLRGLSRSEISAAASEHRGPLLAGSRDVGSNKMRHVRLTATRHPDVRRRRGGVLADDEVGGTARLALHAVHGGRVGEFDV